MTRAPRPPKPDGVAANPRVRVRAPKHSDDTLFQALNRLSKQSPEPSDFSAWHEEISAEQNDRGAAILAATEVENMLERAVKNRLYIGINADGSELFKPTAPLGTFDAKIKIAYALGVIGEETKAELNRIRNIRNAFAHAMKPIKFDTKEVFEVVNKMSVPNLRDKLMGTALRDLKNDIDEKSSPRETFSQICRILSVNLASDAYCVVPGASICSDCRVFAS